MKLETEDSSDTVENKIFYSASNRGFFHTDLHAAEAIPGDAVEITHDQWQDLLNAQVAGKQIVPGDNGHPTLADPVITKEMQQYQLKSQLRAIDIDMMRPMAEHALGVDAPPGEPSAIDRIKAMNEQKAELRAQLAALK
jgi:hypothetical protein